MKKGLITYLKVSLGLDFDRAYSFISNTTPILRSHHPGGVGWYRQRTIPWQRTNEKQMASAVVSQ